MSNKIGNILKLLFALTFLFYTLSFLCAEDETRHWWHMLPINNNFSLFFTFSYSSIITFYFATYVVSAVFLKLISIFGFVTKHLSLITIILLALETIYWIFVDFSFGFELHYYKILYSMNTIAIIIVWKEKRK